MHTCVCGRYAPGHRYTSLPHLVSLVHFTQVVRVEYNDCWIKLVATQLFKVGFLLKVPFLCFIEPSSFL